MGKSMRKIMRKNSEHTAKTGAKTTIPSTCHQPYAIIPSLFIKVHSCTHCHPHKIQSGLIELIPRNMSSTLGRNADDGR
jgi:hypothetical protein